MNETYHLDSGFVSTEWVTILQFAKDLLATAPVVAIKRFVNGKYISTFYLTHVP